MPRIERIRRKDKSPRRLPRAKIVESFIEGSRTEALTVAVENRLKKLTQLRALVNSLTPDGRERVIDHAVRILHAKKGISVGKAIQEAYDVLITRNRKR